MNENLIAYLDMLAMMFLVLNFMEVVFNVEQLDLAQQNTRANQASNIFIEDNANQSLAAQMAILEELKKMNSKLDRLLEERL